MINYIRVTRTAPALAPTEYVGAKELINLRQHTGIFRILSPEQSVPTGSIERTSLQSTKITSTGPISSDFMTGLFSKYKSKLSELPLKVQLIFNRDGKVIGAKQDGKLCGLGEIDDFALLLGASLPKMGELRNTVEFAQVMTELLLVPGLTWKTSKCIVWVGMDRAIHVTNSSLSGILLCGLSDTHMAALVEIKETSPKYIYAPLILYLTLDVLPKAYGDVLEDILVTRLITNI